MLRRQPLQWLFLGVILAGGCYGGAEEGRRPAIDLLPSFKKNGSSHFPGIKDRDAEPGKIFHVARHQRQIVLQGGRRD